MKFNKPYWLVVKPHIQLLPLLALLGMSQLWARDFEAVAEQINVQNHSLQQLEAMHGRYAYELVESLQQLADAQLAANRFDDAEKSLERALQITRVTFGLNTNRQYDLLQMALDIDIRRLNWDSVNQQLQHYTWLLGKKYEGTAPDRMQRMQWLSNAYLRSAIIDPGERRGTYLASATSVNEAAMAYAETTRQKDSAMFPQLVYALTQKYYIEARAIAAGGETGYTLRHINPGIDVVDSRKDALQKRYRAGLHNLKLLSSLLRANPAYSAEAVAMVELHIADWTALFEESEDVSVLYSTAMRSLLEAGLDQQLLNQLFASPVVLPRPKLELSVSQALAVDYPDGSVPVSPLLDPSPNQRLSVLEPSEHIPGFVQDLRSADHNLPGLDNWGKLTVQISLDPSKKAGLWSQGILRERRVTAKQMQLQGSLTSADTELEKILARVERLPFRPVFKDGVAQPCTASLDFIHHGSAASLPSQLLVMR
jgi:hypothetical protein